MKQYFPSFGGAVILCRSWWRVRRFARWNRHNRDFDIDVQRPLLDRNREFLLGGVELVSAFEVESGRWLGSVCTESKSNGIPAARDLLEKIDVAGKTVVADALHTQHETARQIVFDGGGDYVFTVKDNQKTLRQDIEKLLQEQPFSPS